MRRHHELLGGVEHDARLVAHLQLAGDRGGQEDGHVDIADVEQRGHAPARRDHRAGLDHAVFDAAGHRRAQRHVGNRHVDALHLRLRFGAGGGGFADGGGGHLHAGLLAVALRGAALELGGRHQRVLPQLGGVVEFELGDARLHLAHLGLGAGTGHGLLGALAGGLDGSALRHQLGAVLPRNHVAGIHEVALLDRQLDDAARVFGGDFNALDFEPAVGPHQAVGHAIAMQVDPGGPAGRAQQGGHAQAPGESFVVHGGEIDTRR